MGGVHVSGTAAKRRRAVHRPPAGTTRSQPAGARERERDIRELSEVRPSKPVFPLCFLVFPSSPHPTSALFGVVLHGLSAGRHYASEVRDSSRCCTPHVSQSPSPTCLTSPLYQRRTLFVYARADELPACTTIGSVPKDVFEEQRLDAEQKEEGTVPQRPSDDVPDDDASLEG